MTKQFRCDPEQYAMLRRCHEAKDISEWNDWRRDNPDVTIWLEGADMEDWNLKYAKLSGAVSSSRMFFGMLAALAFPRSEKSLRNTVMRSVGS